MFIKFMFFIKMYKMIELTSIQISRDLKRKLKILVAKKDLKNYDELIRLLIKKENGDLQ